MKITKCYPGFTRKAVTFTIDDGNLPMDARFKSIVEPAGIKGTFNLCSDRIKPGDEAKYVEFYRGYEISNHVKYHPFVFRDDTEYAFDKSGATFDEQTADPAYLYPDARMEGFYWKHIGRGWRRYVSAEDYVRYVDECKVELERIFGEGTVRGFVWPFGRQYNARVQSYIEQAGYYGMRITGCLKDSTGFALPADRMYWSYNANHLDLLPAMEAYEAYPDDGELKFFSFGVHSVDFERDGVWDTLSTFAEKYGSRPKDYWYATVGEIFDYADAFDLLEVDEDRRCITNNSDVDLYFEVDGKQNDLMAGFTLMLN